MMVPMSRYPAKRERKAPQETSSRSASRRWPRAGATRIAAAREGLAKFAPSQHKKKWHTRQALPAAGPGARPHAMYLYVLGSPVSRSR